MAALALAVVSSTACIGGGGDAIPKPPPTSALSPTTVVDVALHPLSPVPGRGTTTTVVIGPGEATLKGTVNAPDGLVPGAIVRAERLVGDGVASVDIITKPDGTWTIPAVLGGRYRVRAWRAPDLALTKPEVFFLEAKGTKEFTLKVDKFGGAFAQGAIAPSPPLVDEPANLVVQVSQREVDAGGVVRSTPLPGVTAELVGSGAYRLDSGNPATTDDAGEAIWQLRCREAGRQPLSVTINSTDTFPIQLPDCVDPGFQPEPAPTTTVAQ